MIYIEQHGSSSYYIKNMPEERPLERYELVELLREALNQGIDPREFLESDMISRLVEEEGDSLF